MQKSSGFTLIELLIVVAIIAILAAIAVPNFLEAQVRSKVSRCKSDMRTQVTAMESYYIDNNKYPPAGDSGGGVITPNNARFHARMPNFLTTPISYITSLPEDVFLPESTWSSGEYPEDTRVGYRYVYYNWDWYLTPAAGGSNPQGFADFWNGARDWTGEWLIYGYGPDKNWNNDPAQGSDTFMPYDSTNGTISYGNIIRCQKDTNGVPPHPISGDYIW